MPTGTSSCGYRRRFPCGEKVPLPPMTRAAPLAAQATAVIIWATAIVVAASALVTTSPAVLTMLRFGLAAILLVPLALGRGGLSTTCRSPVTAALGLTGVSVYYGLQSVGLPFTTPGTAALMQAALPVATAVLAASLLGERPGRRIWAGLALATTGVVLVGASGARIDVGATVILLGVIGYAVYTVMLRHWGTSEGSTVSSVDPVVLSAATALWGLVFLTPWQVWEIAAGRAALPTDAGAILAVLYLGVVASGLTLLLWTFGASHSPASLSGALTAAVPALGYAAAVLAGEQATWVKAAGGALAVTGVLVATAAQIRPTSAY